MFFIAVPAGQSEDETVVSAQPIYPVYEAISLQYWDIKNDTERMLGSAKFFKSTDKKIEIYKFNNTGLGNWMEHIDAKFSQIAKFEPFEGGVRVLESASVILDDDGKDVVRYTKEFDYERNQVIFIKKARIGARKFERFDIKGPICDDVSLVYFLKSFNIRDFINEPYHIFYLITNEPKLYKVRMNYVANENIDIEGISRKAIKYQLKADMNILTDIAAKIVPPTYVWYARDYPYEWLQYQGMESGFRSPYIKITVMGRTYDDPRQ